MEQFTPKCFCGKRLSGICDGQGDCAKVLPFKPLKEAQKADLQKKSDALLSELPQEIRDSLSDFSFRKNEVKNAAFKGIATIGALIASAHYEPQLTAKDQRIAELEEQVKRLEHAKDQDRRVITTEREVYCKVRDDMNDELEKLKGLLKGLLFSGDSCACVDEYVESVWADFCKTHKTNT